MYLGSCDGFMLVLSNCESLFFCCRKLDDRSIRRGSRGHFPRLCKQSLSFGFHRSVAFRMVESNEPKPTMVLGRIESLSPDCTPLKHQYDGCFNAWFKEYLEIATQGTTNNAYEPRNTMFSSAKPYRLAQLRDQYERECGKLFSMYQSCVRVRRPCVFSSNDAARSTR